MEDQWVERAKRPHCFAASIRPRGEILDATGNTSVDSREIRGAPRAPEVRDTAFVIKAIGPDLTSKCTRPIERRRRGSLPGV